MLRSDVGQLVKAATAVCRMRSEIGFFKELYAVAACGEFLPLIGTDGLDDHRRYRAAQIGPRRRSRFRPAIPKSHWWWQQT